MENGTKEISSMTKQLEKERCITMMVQFTKVISKIIGLMDEEKRHMQMVLCSQESFHKVKRVKVNSYGLMVQSI